MKKIILISIVFLSINSIHSQINQKSDLNKLKLIGLVKSIEQRGFIAIQKFGEVISENAINDIYDFNSLIQFDTKGDILSINQLSLEGVIKGDNVYKTYLNGIQPIKMKGYDFPEKYKYDENNNISEIIYNNDDGKLDFKRLYKYDSLGNLIEEKVYLKDGVLDSMQKYKNDSFGNVIEINQYMPSTKQTNTKTIKYFFDIYNNWIKKIITYEGKLDAVIERKIVYY